jgi:hypothetical protein
VAIVCVRLWRISFFFPFRTIAPTIALFCSARHPHWDHSMSGPAALLAAPFLYRPPRTVFLILHLAWVYVHPYLRHRSTHLLRLKSTLSENQLRGQEHRMS